MLVSEWMTRGPITLRPDNSVAGAAALMAHRNIRRIPVVDAGGKLVGIVTKTDVLRSCPPNVNPFSAAGLPEGEPARPIREIMSRSPVTIHGDGPIEAAAQRMLQHRIGALPVVTGNALSGIITESDIFRAFSVALGASEGGLRITLQGSGQDDLVTFVVDVAARHGVQIRSVATYQVDERRTAVIRLVGKESPELIDALWTKGHRVSSVLRLDGGAVPNRSR